LDAPSFELGGKAATRTIILSGQCVAGNVAGFSFDGRFHTITELDFLSQVFMPLGFLALSRKRTKKGRIIGLKNMRVVNGNGCKKNLSQTGPGVLSGKKGS
jgi:hypothetical protein